MLIIGLGGGVVAEDISPSVRQIDVIELEPKVVAANQTIAAERNINPLADERINITINDARNTMRLSEKRYDAIISQPSHPWTAGASHLYTREFMELARSRLTDDGVFLQWMNMQFVSEQLLSSLAATLLDVFPYVRAYHFDPNVIFFLASQTPVEPEQSLAETGEPLASQASVFRRKGIATINDIVAALAWDVNGLRAIAGASPIITDDNNLMALRSGGYASDPTMSYVRLKALMREHGPLYDPASTLHRELAEHINFVYIADRLAMFYAPELMVALMEALVANDNPQGLIIAGRVAARQSESRQADRALLAALEADPQDETAAFLLLRDRGDSLAEGSLPSRIAPYAENLSPASRAAVVNLTAAISGQETESRALDAVLANVEPDALWYLDAAMLRVNWRIRAMQIADSATLADEAMEIIDDIIAVYQDLDFYGMRMAASFLAKDYTASLETARRMNWSIRSNIEFQLEAADETLTRRELQAEVLRLRSMREGLEAIRETGTIEAARLDELDVEIDELLRFIEDTAFAAARN